MFKSATSNSETSNNELQKVFNYEGHQVRTVMINGEPWLVAKDVCQVLGIVNSKMATARLPERMKDGVSITDPIGRDQVTTVVSEAGVYKLIFQSRKPEAEKFADWVAEEVLPSIRKTGMYIHGQKLPTHSELMHMITGEILKHDKEIAVLKQRMDDTDAKFEETEDVFIKVLCEPSDRATFTRKVRELAKMRFAGRIHHAYSVIYQRLKEMYGVDITARTMNERKRLQQERREQGLKPYAQSTLEAKVSQVDVLERIGLMDEAMEIVVGSIAKYWKEKGRDNNIEEVC